jgi:hypothetical protein
MIKKINEPIEKSRDAISQLSKPQNKEARRELEEAFYETVCRVVTDNRRGKIDRVRIAVIR